MIAYLLLSSLIGLALLPLFLYFNNPYFLKDLRFAITTLHIAFRLSKMKKHKPFYSILDCFLEKVSRQPDKAFIVFEERSYTYHQADTLSSKAAAALRTHAHLEEGDTVALFLGNEPQFVWLWLGLAKLGCTASLLNTNIRSKSLLHCFSCCEAKVLVAGAGKMGETLRCCPALLLWDRGLPCWRFNSLQNSTSRSLLCQLSNKQKFGVWSIFIHCLLSSSVE